jgi:hypothetical protein
MISRKPQNGQIKYSHDLLRVANPHVAGIDVHAAVHWIAVPPDHVSLPRSAQTDSNSSLPLHVRKFGACTADLELLADWLQQCGITTVAMESTGVY